MATSFKAFIAKITNLCGLTFLAISALAQASGTIVTDRPDFVESSDVVCPGCWQIEMGFSTTREGSHESRTHSRTTPTLIRVSVSDTVELRAESDNFERRTTRDLVTGETQRVRGFNDISIGGKWHLQDGNELIGRPGIALLAHIDIDSGSAPLRGQGYRPSLRAVAEWDLPDDLSFGVMPGIVLDRNAEGKRFTGYILALTMGKSWTPKWRTFMEIAAQHIASKRDGGSVVTFDAGMAYLLSNSLQLDFAVAQGLTASSPNLQWGVGLSARF